MTCPQCAEPIISGASCDECGVALCVNCAGYDGLCDLCREENEDYLDERFDLEED